MGMVYEMGREQHGDNGSTLSSTAKKQGIVVVCLSSCAYNGRVVKAMGMPTSSVRFGQRQ